MADAMREPSAEPPRERFSFRAFRAALSGLTAQGRSVIAAGIVVVVFSPVLGEKELVQVAVLLISVPLLAAIATMRMRAPLRARRATTTRRIAVGQSATVHLAVEALRETNRSARLEERVPPELDPTPHRPNGRGAPTRPHPDADGPRFILGPLPEGGEGELEYHITPRQRGHYLVGPLAIALGDPFGMCTVPHPISGAQHVIVTPAVTPLPPNALIDGRADTGADRGRQPGGHSDDATVRAYQHGDEPRRVHWRSTARTGELMVRSQEHPRHATATVLLDTRAGAHVGSGADGSFEWAVSAAASVVRYLAAKGLLVTLRTDTGAGVSPAELDSQLAKAMDFLAGVTTSNHTDLTGFDQADLGHGVVVGIFGALTDADVHTLRRRAFGGGERPGVALALTIDPARWSTATTLSIMVPQHEFGGGGQQIPGWHTAVARQSGGQDLAQLWRTLGVTPIGSAAGAPR